MRPVNLIPQEQRRGGARGVGGAPPVTPAHVLLGVLAAGVLAVGALALVSNQVNRQRNKLVELAPLARAAKAKVDALRPYGDFAKLQEDRYNTVAGLARSRFNWERMIRQLSRTIPSNAWLTKFTGTVSPDVSLPTSGGGGGSSLREDVKGPAVELTGCADSQETVARMMVRMRNLDGAAHVTLTDSNFGGNQQGSARQAPRGGSTGPAGDCPRYEYKMLIAFGGPALPPPAGGGQAAPPAAKAEAAASTAEGQGSSSSTGAGE